MGKKPFQVLLGVLSGYTLAIICLSLLFILTWLSTLEQPGKGLYEVQQRYYSATSWFVSPDLDFIPKVRGNSIVPPLPSAYLVSWVLFFNLTLGGLIRIKKNWKKWGVILSHFSMVGLLVTGFVSHHQSKEGIMLVFQGDTSDYAQSYTEYSIELALYEGGVKQPPYVIPAKDLMALVKDDELLVNIPPLGLKVKVTDWLANSELVEMQLKGETHYSVIERSTDPQAEANLAACKITLQGEGLSDQPIQLHARRFEHHIETTEGAQLGVRLIKEIWPLPFSIQLDSSIGEYHPNTERPKYFESKVTKLNSSEDSSGENYTIRMNEPLRYNGYTLYQARWMGDAVRPQSGFAVVQNPAGQWPKYCLYLSILGLTSHFGYRLYRYLLTRPTQNR